MSAATPAQAKLITREESLTVPAVQGEVGSVRARCPRGAELVGGGYRTPPPPAALLPFQSRPAGNDAWRASAVQATNMPLASELKVFAYCDTRAAPTSVETNARKLSSAGGVGVRARCPRGERAIGGGFGSVVDFPGDRLGVIQESRRARIRAWRAVAVDEGSNPSTLTAYALCAKRVGSLRSRRGGATLASNATTPVSAPTHRCPGKVRSGGFSLSNQTNDSQYSVFASLRRGDRWVTSVRGFSAPETRLTSFAYCP